MEIENRKLLKAITLTLRHILEGYYDSDGKWHPGDLEQRLRELGVRRDRDPLPIDELPQLSDNDKNAREVFDAYLALRQEAGISRTDTVAEFVRETSYTWANRLLALRCMESRELIDEVILTKDAYGGRSLQHHRLAQRNPELCTGDDDGLYTVLCDVFLDLAEIFSVLFDNSALGIEFRPSPFALKECLNLLSLNPDTLSKYRIKPLTPSSTPNPQTLIPNPFSSPDSLGWAYQYWNTEEKNRVFDMVRTKKGAKIEGADIIPATQLYTESYMVKFLVQNSLGATWMGMYPESKLFEKWEYYVKDADRAPVEKKPVKEITFLDPACGSGHFLLEAFDLYYDMYLEEGELTEPEEVCKSILENNLYGIDIDGRAVQIAEAVLWMKASEIAPKFKCARSNLLATNIHLPKGKDHLKAFLKKYPEDHDLRPALEVIFESLEHVDELGSLLKIEEPVEEQFQLMKSNLPLFKDIRNWDEWKKDVLERLQLHFERESVSAEFGQAFFSQSANKGIALFDFLSRKYDIVAANPPYMGSKNMGAMLKKYVDKHYNLGKRDLYAAFILRCRELTCPSGKIAMVTQQSWMFLRSFASLRAVEEDKLKSLSAKDFTGLLRETSLETLAHLGPHAFQEIGGEVVNIALFTFANSKPDPEHKLTAFRLIGPKSPEEKDSLLLDSLAVTNISVINNIHQVNFLLVILSPLIYWIPISLMSFIAQARRFSQIGEVPKGLTTGDNNRFLRFFWESAENKCRWFNYVKAGNYAKWYGLNHYAVDWEKDGVRIRNFIDNNGKLRSRPQNVKYYFKEGFTYSEMAGGAMGCRYLPPNSIFDARSPAIYILKEQPELIIPLLNTRIQSYILRCLSPSLLFDQAYIPYIPCPLVNDLKLHKIVIYIHKSCLYLKELICENDVLERNYQNSSDKTLFPLKVSMWLHFLESINEIVSFSLFEANEKTIDTVVNETGTPAGWFPLIQNYDKLLPLQDLPCEIPTEVLEYLEKHERKSISEQDLSNIKTRLRSLYESGPGVKEEIEETVSATSDDEESEEVAIGARIPIPAETFLEELSQKMEIHPISIYWLLKEGIEKEGWRCLPEERRIMSDRFTVMILHMLGYRWPKQIEANEPVPDWADKDGIIPLTETGLKDEQSLLTRVRERIRVDFNGGDVNSIEREFSEVMGKPLDQWLETEFFKHHTKQFKKRPIAWQIQSGKFTSKKKPAFACLVFYHKMDGDMLPKIRNQYVGPLRNRYETEMRTIEGIVKDSRSERQNKRLLELEDMIQELREFDERLKAVQDIGFSCTKLDDLISKETPDKWCSIDGVKQHPTDKAAFKGQEERYLPDINDGVRVNIVPLQRAGLLAADVIAKKDLEKAISDRSEWRSDERRWCREGKLPKPGFWPEQEGEKNDR